MDQKKLTPGKQINGWLFYKYPYMDVYLAVQPAGAIHHIWEAWKVMIKNRNDAADFLEHLVRRGRSIGLQVFLYIESLDALPEAHGVTPSILALEKNEKFYSTPPSGSAYRFEKLRKLFGDRL